MQPYIVLWLRGTRLERKLCMSMDTVKALDMFSALIPGTRRKEDLGIHLNHLMGCRQSCWREYISVQIPNVVLKGGEDIGTLLTWCSFQAGLFLAVHQPAGNCFLAGFPVRMHGPLSFSSI